MTKSKIYFLFKVTFLPLFRVELWAGFMEISAKVFMKDIVLWQHFGRSENINSSQKRHTREVNKHHLMMLTLHIRSPKNGDPTIISEENKSFLLRLNQNQHLPTVQQRVAKFETRY